MDSKKTPLSFTIQLADGTQAVEERSQDKITIGKSKDASLCINDSLAATHCLVRVSEGPTVTIMDLGTDAGTLVRNAKIEDETTLQDGDEIQLKHQNINFGGAVLNPTVPGRVPAGVTELTEEQPDDDATEVIEATKPSVEKSEKLSMTNEDQKTQKNDVTQESKAPANKAYVEIAMYWGSALMGVKRLASGNALVVGSEEGAHFNVSTETLTANHTLVEQGDNGAVVIPGPGKKASVTEPKKRIVFNWVE